MLFFVWEIFYILYEWLKKTNLTYGLSGNAASLLFLVFYLPLRLSLNCESETRNA